VIAVTTKVNVARRRLSVGIALLAAGLVSAPLVLATAGTWLVVDDPLQPARSIVVLAGMVPFRAMEAAAVYKEGWAREVWLTKGAFTEESFALSQLEVDRPPEYVYSRQVLERMGVPAEAVHEIPEWTANTAEEVRAIAKQLRAIHGERVIVITSKYHTRRVKVIWRTLVGSYPEAIVRYTPLDRSSPTRWWRNTAEAMSVSREWFGLLNAWTGFPIKSERW
jgi:uncharacterized SAM-binding protein YcdF (DUF218 family)